LTWEKVFDNNGALFDIEESVLTDFYNSARPLTRWWWFSGPISEDVIKFQLDWLKDNGFGGVEIAWVYPLKNSKPGPKWLSPEWTKCVKFAKDHANGLGLSCDFTFGSLWPFGGSIVSEKDAQKDFKGLSSQRIGRSWEMLDFPDGVPVLNHLDHVAFERYAAKMGAALPLEGQKSGIFCDSLELDNNGLWTEGFREAFEKRFGYDILPFMERIDEHPDKRYDYRKLVADLMLEEFFKPYAKYCREHNGFARVQAHGAPADLVAAYATADVPESEAVLFDPHFSQFAASAATLSGKNIVTAETFTCLYGFRGGKPGFGPHQGEEKISDLKLLADAMFANGVNLVIWHGMPYNPQYGRQHFYATTHLGPDSPFASCLKGFNAYLEKVGAAMQSGRNYTDIACLLPLEDNFMKGELPRHLHRPSAMFHWELQYQLFPRELDGCRPCWVTAHFLKDARFAGGKLTVGSADFTALYIDSEWLDMDCLKDVLRLAKAGLPVCIKRKPGQPGFRKSAEHWKLVDELCSLSNVSSDLARVRRNPPLVELVNAAPGARPPESWCRTDGQTAHIFFANPKTREIKYPLSYGQSETKDEISVPVRISIFGKTHETTLNFKPNQSLMVEIWAGGVRPVDVEWSSWQKWG
jgi:hypothetical protein